MMSLVRLRTYIQKLETELAQARLAEALVERLDGGRSARAKVQGLGKAVGLNGHPVQSAPTPPDINPATGKPYKLSLKVRRAMAKGQQRRHGKARKARGKNINPRTGMPYKLSAKVRANMAAGAMKAAAARKRDAPATKE